MDWDWDRPSGRELMRLERERLRERAPFLPARTDAVREVRPIGPMSGFETPGESRPAPTLSTGVTVLKVPCPACKAAAGMPCFIPAVPDKRPNGGTHPSRRELAQGTAGE